MRLGRKLLAPKMSNKCGINNNADIEDAATVLTITYYWLMKNVKVIISDSNFWFETERCSNRRQNLLPDETDTRFV